MSRVAFAYDTDAAKSSNARQSSSMRVSHPGDSFELEADRVADTVSRGGRISGWSLSSSGFDGIQRQAAPPPSAGEIAGKVAEALLATPEGKQAVAAVTAVVETPAGMVVTGTAAVGLVAALAKAKQPLPAQAPAIPLDVLHPGLSVKITYQGPVNQPTAASITFSYTPKSPESKPAQSASEKLRAENAAMAADQAKFRAGLHLQDAQGPVRTPEQQMFDKWRSDKLAAIGSFARPLVPAPAGTNDSAPKAAAASEKKPELKSAPAAVPTPIHAISGTEKKEEIPIQRKAESSAPVTTGSADVDSVLRASGRPLDPSTRREMESRIGYDFSSVRLHTDSRAADSAQSLSAHAYTVGSNVVFAPGRYAPQTGEGRRLLAHELTHVVQQTTWPQRAHPAVRPAPRQVQRAWSGRDIPGVSWLLDKLKGLKGYPLFCVIIGKDLIDDVEVERNATTLTQGILNLFPGGSELFEKLKKAAGALQSAYHWLTGEIDKLGFSEKYFSDLLDRAWEGTSIWHPADSWERTKAIFSEPYDRLVSLASKIASKVLDFIFEAALDAFPAGKKVFAFLKKAGDTISSIIADPINFAKNLFAAVQKGFTDFGLNILTHLGNGLKAWIFDELAIKGVTMPTEFSFASMLKLILQVLGLTYEQRRPQLVEKLGETAVTFFETSVKIFERIRTEGFSAIWEMIKEKASSIFDSLIDGIKNWVIQEIVKRGLLMVAALASPIGDFIEVVTSIYEVIEFLVEKARKLADLVETVVDALADIVAGNIGPAAKKVEDSLARTIPLLLRFLAGLLHLTGIGASIRKIVDDVRKPIDEAIGKVLDIIVENAKPLWEAGKAAFTAKLDAIKNWWTKPKKFRWGTEEHEVNVEGDGEHPEVFVHSAEKTPLKQFLKDVKATPAQTKKIVGLADKLGWRQGELQKPSDDAAGAKTYDDLTFELDHLKARDAYPSRLVRPQTTHTKLGTGIEADVMLSANRGLGTDPVRGQDPVGWTDLGYLLDEKYYRRGHLLSNRLGGQGEWVNMMPITNAVNGRMNAKVEAPLKKATANTDRAYHYIVTASYEDVDLPEPDTKLSPAKNKKLRAEAAEKRLKRISWTVQMAKGDDKSGQLVDDPDAKGVIDGDGNAMPSEVVSSGLDPKDT